MALHAHSSVLGRDRIGRERLGEIVEGEHPHSMAHRGPMANGQKCMTCLREFFQRNVIWRAYSP